MAGIKVRAARLPLVEVEYPRTPTQADLEDAFARYEEISREGRPLAYLVDMRACNPIAGSAKDRKHAAAVFARHADALMRVTVCEARVFSSPAIQGIVTAFDWLTGTKWPCSNFVSAEKAEEWVVERLRAKGLTVPPK